MALLGLLAAAEAGRVGEDGTGAMWVAPELMDAGKPATLLGCANRAVAQVADLTSAGRVAFEWHPATSELSFDGHAVMPQVTLPEDWLPGSQDLSLTTWNCGSR